MISPELVQVWFLHTSQQMQGMLRGCAFLGEPESGAYQACALFPESFPVDNTTRQNVDTVIKQRKPLVTRLDATAKGQHYQVTYPVSIDGKLYGAVAIQFQGEMDLASADSLAQVEASIRWLQCLAQFTPLATSQETATAIKLIALSLSQDSAEAAATAVVSELARHLKCHRVGLALFTADKLGVYALSHSAHYEEKQNLLSLMLAAIQAAIGQRQTLLFPAQQYSAAEPLAELAHSYDSCAICSVPVMHNNALLGGVLFERAEGSPEFSQAQRELCEQLSLLVVPILEYRRRDDQSLWRKLTSSASKVRDRLVNPQHFSRRFLAVLVAMFLLVMLFVPGDYEVSANAALEGRIERVITAAEDGFINTASSRPGDLVQQDQVLATLDDRDLRLEKLKWDSKFQQVSKEYREALARHERAQIGRLRAQLDQARAQIEILDEKLQRISISSPIAGVIVAGDLTRTLGSPVERGQLLYTISPLDEYRVVLQIDEAEIALIKLGMQGELTLAAAAAETFVLQVEKITPVSIAENGANYFQVEASLQHSPEFLRPGMQGVAKVSIGERKLLWIYTHKLFDWLRLKLWQWW